MIRYPRVTVQGRIEQQETEVTDSVRSLFVGATDRGPAYVKTAIGTVEDLHRIFGTEGPTVKAAENLIRTGGVPKIIRVMDEIEENPNTIEIRDAQDDTTLAVLIYTGTNDDLVLIADGNVQDFNIGFYGNTSTANPVESIDLSFSDQSENFIGRLDEDNFELYLFFEDAYRDREITTPVVADIRKGLDLSSQSISRPETPWIVSGDFEPNTERVPLFKIFYESDGRNRDIKISISEINEETGTFALEVRDYTDNDFNPEILERFELLSMNENDERFIGEIIGTRRTFYENGEVLTTGRFDGQSRYISVQIASNVLPDGIYPYGHEGYRAPYEASVALPDPTFRTTQSVGLLSQYVQFQRNEKDDIFLGTDVKRNDMSQYLNPVVSEVTTQAFNLEDATDVIEEKFTVAFQGGYDGSLFYDTDKKQGLETEQGNLYGITRPESFETAYDILNRELFLEEEILVIPDSLLQVHVNVIDDAEEFCRNQKNMMFVTGYDMPFEPSQTIKDPKLEIESSYVAVYQGWVQDHETSHPVANYVPSAYLENDNRQGFEKTPAGNSAELSVEDLYIRYKKDEEQRFLDLGINYIHDSRLGYILRGQKTLLSGDKPLTEVKVRRGLNRIIGNVEQAAQNTLFQNTTDGIEDTISNTLQVFQTEGLLETFQIKISEIAEENRLDASIQVQFTETTEFIDISFSIIEDVVVFT